MRASSSVRRTVSADRRTLFLHVFVVGPADQLRVVTAVPEPATVTLLGLGGLISIVWGVLLAIFPIPGAVVLTIWLGAYALIFGVAMIVFASRLRSRC